MIQIFLATITDENQRYAIEQIFEKYYAKMVHAANKILHNMCDAEDAVMEAFRKMCKVPERFLDYESKEVIHLAFLYVESSAKTVYAKNKSRNSNEIPLDPEEHQAKMEAIPDPDADLDRIMINAINKGIMFKAIDSLEDDYRMIIVMRYYYAMKNCEIAELMGVDTTTIANRAYRARKKLMDFVLANGIIL